MSQARLKRRLCCAEPPAIVGSSDAQHLAVGTMSAINKNLQGRRTEVRLLRLLLVLECAATAAIRMMVDRPERSSKQLPPLLQMASGSRLLLFMAFGACAGLWPYV